MSASFQHRFILTGGPGSGKSAIIDSMIKRGFWCSKEAGRGVIQDQVNIGGDALPWANQRAFAELMLSWEMRSWHEAEGQNHYASSTVAFLMFWVIYVFLNLPYRDIWKTLSRNFAITEPYLSHRPGVRYMYRMPSANNLMMLPLRHIMQW